MNRDWAVYNVNNFVLTYGRSENRYDLCSVSFTNKRRGDVIATYTPFLNGTCYISINYGGYSTQISVYEDGIYKTDINTPEGVLGVKAFHTYTFINEILQRDGVSGSVRIGGIIIPKMTGKIE